MVQKTDEPLPIGLAAWIIQDGNYPDFEVGQERAFAVEFYAPERLKIASQKLVKLQRSGADAFDAAGLTTWNDPDWCVLDFGIPAYSDRPPLGCYEIGSVFEGSIHLSVDHYSYFEFHAHEPNAPALIFDWKIERIEI